MRYVSALKFTCLKQTVSEDESGIFEHAVVFLWQVHREEPILSSLSREGGVATNYTMFSLPAMEAEPPQLHSQDQTAGSGSNPPARTV